MFYKKTQGLTLVEILIAMTFLLVASVGMGSMINICSLNTQISKEKTIAANAARAIFENISNHPFSNVFNNFGVDNSNNTFYVSVAANGGIIQPCPPEINNPDFVLQAIDANTPIGVIQFPTRNNVNEELLEVLNQLGNTPIEDSDNDGNLDLSASDIWSVRGFNRNIDGKIGMDLNGDNILSDTPIDGTTCVVLPVRILIRWRGRFGNIQRYELNSIISIFSQ